MTVDKIWLVFAGTNMALINKLQGSEKIWAGLVTPPRTPVCEVTDESEEALAEFAADICARLVQGRARGQIEGILIAAPQRTLCAIQKAMPQDVQDCLLGQIERDQTDLPAAEAQNRFFEELSAGDDPIVTGRAVTDFRHEAQVARHIGKCNYPNKMITIHDKKLPTV